MGNKFIKGFNTVASALAGAAAGKVTQTSLSYIVNSRRVKFTFSQEDGKSYYSVEAPRPVMERFVLKAGVVAIGTVVGYAVSEVTNKMLEDTEESIRMTVTGELPYDVKQQIFAILDAGIMCDEDSNKSPIEWSIDKITEISGLPREAVAKAVMEYHNKSC